MVELIITFVIILALIFAVCFIGSLVLAKDTKDFHIRFGLMKGFDISGSFYKNDATENHQ